MEIKSTNRRWLIGLGLAGWTVTTVAALAIVLSIFFIRSAADYPGAMLVSDHSLYRISPRLYVRRDTSYRTTDAFPVVYNFYSNGFKLGPEKHAEGSCILMENTQSIGVLQNNMAVMLCDTQNGRMIFVMRSFTLR